MGQIYEYIYGFIILTSIYTSAISAGYGVLEQINQNTKRYKITAMLMCIIAPLISQIGFSNLVNLLYPIFGILGLIQITLLINK